jgi:hypothetical protein
MLTCLISVVFLEITLYNGYLKKTTKNLAIRLKETIKSIDSNIKT